MLMPKRTKWRRPHRRSLKGKAHKGTKVKSSLINQLLQNLQKSAWVLVKGRLITG